METTMTLRSLTASAALIALSLAGSTIPAVSGEAAQPAPFRVAAVQGAAPDFTGLGNWYNSAPLKISERHGITYPVAQDNDSKTWSAYRNQYWPSQYIIDQNGKIVFQHDGEGQYDQIDRTIERLLNANS